MERLHCPWQTSGGIGEADKHMHSYGGCEISCPREWSVNDLWCCGSIEEEVIHVREILLADYILFPKLALMSLAHFIY